MEGLSSHVYRNFELKIAIDAQNVKKYKFKRVVAKVSQIDRLALNFGI
ncbi:uncharacterized protein G2W53_010334 [Senna tora]|uniref:Uncharacterized protein n=1 Tax=Senna tora TaxID=362788 RepID=A0A834WZ27_9FABA|nr:uncharacterized protein G2W53_010334 [Senna tora]